MTQILALTQRNGDQRGWLHLQRQDAAADWECIGVNGSLEAMADAAMVKQARHPKAGFSFSFPRDAAAFMALPFENQPSADEIRAVFPGFSLTFLMPVGSEHYGDLWCHVWRDPRGNLSSSRKARFVGQVLVNEMRAWFNFYQPQKIAKGLAGAVELHARHDWSAYAWLGEEAFPSPKQHPQAFLAAKAAHEARRAKRKGKPVKHAEAAE